MSHIIIRIYNGNAEAYDDHDETGTVGTRVVEQVFTDGEELAAAAAIANHLAAGRHFDVRQRIN